jgi:hypothetical protein
MCLSRPLVSPVASFPAVCSPLSPSLSFRRTRVLNPPARAPPPPEPAFYFARNSRQSCVVAVAVPRTWGWLHAPVPPPLGDGGRSCCCHRQGCPGRGRRRPCFVCLVAPKRRGRASCRGPLLLHRPRFVCRGRAAHGRGRETLLPVLLRTPRDGGERICLRPAPRVNLEQGRR